MLNKLPFILIILSLYCPIQAAEQAKAAAKTNPKYYYEETVHVPLPEVMVVKWKVDYQKADESGCSSTRYIPEFEKSPNWTQLINIQFKDKKKLPGKDALEVMKWESANSKNVTYKTITQTKNEILYERTFPTGEHEIVRMVMTEKGLHRIAYVRRGKLPDEEKTQWIERLSKGTIKGKQ